MKNIVAIAKQAIKSAFINNVKSTTSFSKQAAKSTNALTKNAISQIKQTSKNANTLTREIISKITLTNSIKHATTNAFVNETKQANKLMPVATVKNMQTFSKKTLNDLSLVIKLSEVIVKNAFKSAQCKINMMPTEAYFIFHTYFMVLATTIKFRVRQLQFTDKSNIASYKALSSQKKSAMLVRSASMLDSAANDKQILKIMQLIIKHSPSFIRIFIFELITNILAKSTNKKQMMKESVLSIKLVDDVNKEMAKSFILSVYNAIVANKQTKKLKLVNSIDTSSNVNKCINKSEVSTVNLTMDYTKDVKKSLHTYENVIVETSKATLLDRLARTHAFISFYKQISKIGVLIIVAEVKINRFITKQSIIATKVNSNVTKLIQKSFMMVLNYTSLVTSRIFHQMQEFWVKANGLWHKLESLMIKDSKGDYQHIYELKQKEKNQWKH